MLSGIPQLLIRKDANMTTETKYFVIPASSGLCIQSTRNKTETVPVQGKDNQLWHIEKGKKSKIAFRNVDSGDYLRATGGYKSNAVKLGARQWWTLETSDTPGACWFVNLIKCDDYPNAYLCNSYGNITPNNTIYMWAKEDYWAQTMLWYIADLDSWKKHKSSKPDLQFLSKDTEKNGDSELETRLREAEEKQHKLEEKLKASENRQQELESKEQASARQLAQYALKETELDKREQELKTKEEKAAAESNDEENGDTSDELLALRNKIAKLQKESEQMSTVKDELRAEQSELAKVQQAYEDLKSGDANENAQANASSVDQNSIFAERFQSEFAGVKAAGVGSRDTPLGLRTREARPTTTKGRLAPIQLQQDFNRLPRLRSNRIS